MTRICGLTECTGGRSFNSLTHHTGEGWTYFVTTKVWQSTLLFPVEETAKIIVAKMLDCRDKGNYLVHDVVMPNHLHVILTLAPSWLKKAVQLIKGGSSPETKLVERPEAWGLASASASGKFTINPIHQGLKPIAAANSDVGPEGPTPDALTESHAKSSRGLKLPLLKKRVLRTCL